MTTNIHNAALLMLRPNHAYSRLAIYSCSSDQQGPSSGCVSPQPRTSGEGNNVKPINVAPINCKRFTCDRPLVNGSNQKPIAPINTPNNTSGCNRTKRILKKSQRLILPHRSSYA